MLPPTLVDALYTAHRADTHRRQLELERARRALPPQPAGPQVTSAVRHSRGTWLHWLLSPAHTPRSGAPGPGDA